MHYLMLFNRIKYYQLNNQGFLDSLLDELGQLKEQPINNFFVYPQIHNKRQVKIVQEKLKLLRDEASQTENDFYTKLLLNDQRPTFYQD
ncbi:unnamed protein product [Paramecium primaurelia]|uniref:Uncharacterized protein n=1 Tax=Paramecium primaurelia TaxID=5886 RepID=A0A8S1JNL5_PARPR|nr:unnamed protein product [Paramecium primaurelia]